MGRAALNYYAVLGLNSNANEAEIKIQYKKLALKYHPDKNRDPGSTEVFQEIATAYNVLSNPEKRARYDRLGAPQKDETSEDLGEAIVKVAPLCLSVLVGGFGGAIYKFGWMSFKICFFLQTFSTVYVGKYFSEINQDNYKRFRQRFCKFTPPEKKKTEKEKKHEKVKAISDFVTIAAMGLVTGNISGFIFAVSCRFCGRLIGISS